MFAEVDYANGFRKDSLHGHHITHKELAVRKDKKKTLSLIIVTILAICSFLFYQYGRSIWFSKYLKLRGQRSVEDVVSIYEERVNNRLTKNFSEAKITFPPEEIRLIAFKDTKELNLWCSNGQHDFVLVKTYKIKGASGVLGPKLQEGDRQVTEGIYKIEGLNPNSSYHLSMKLNYPNAFDLKYAKLEGRKNPGSNIFIHGKSGSIGCLAMGDRAIEELFILSNKVGLKNIEVIITPTDVANQKDMSELLQNKPYWALDLYRNIQIKLQKYD